MRIAIVGAGAIGGWMAGALARADSDVSLLARGRTLEVLRAHGLSMVEEGEHETFHLPASDDPAALGEQDAIVIALKGHDLPELAPRLGPLLGPDTAVVTAMNGLPWWFFQGFACPLQDRSLETIDPGGTIAATVAPERVLGAVVHASVRNDGPAVAHVVKVDKLILGELGGESSDRVQSLAALLTEGGIPTTVTDNVRSDIWAKLWGNMNMNPISALTRRGTAPLYADPETRALIAGMMTEMQTIGEHIGLSLPMSVDERIALTHRLGDFRTSMLQDAEAGRRLEIDPILGCLVEIADALEIPVPLSRAVYGLARQLSVGLAG